MGCLCVGKGRRVRAYTHLTTLPPGTRPHVKPGTFATIWANTRMSRRPGVGTSVDVEPYRPPNESLGDLLAMATRAIVWLQATADGQR